MLAERASRNWIVSLTIAVCFLFVLNVDQYVRIYLMTKNADDSMDAASTVYMTQRDNDSAIQRIQGRLEALENAARNVSHRGGAPLLANSPEIRKLEREIDSLKTEVQSLRLFKK